MNFEQCFKSRLVRSFLHYTALSTTTCLHRFITGLTITKLEVDKGVFYKGVHHHECSIVSFE